MNNSYRVYAKIDDEYELISIADSEDVAKLLSRDNIYSRVLVVKGDHEIKIDKTHMLTFPGNIKGIPRKIRRKR